jgi:peroxiredoxin
MYRGTIDQRALGGMMSQAEIAGDKLTLTGELPSKGKRLPEVELLSFKGQKFHLSDYRGRSNLVVLLIDERPETKRLLTEIANKFREIQNADANVLAIRSASLEPPTLPKASLNFPFEIFSDPDRVVHHQLGATDEQNRDAAALYVTDRFGEVFGIYRIRDGQPLPSVDEILNWLEFINAQCPECEPPEWPL